MPSVVSLDDRPIITSAVGCELSTTVNVAVPPDSVVVRPVVGVTMIVAWAAVSVRLEESYEATRYSRPPQFQTILSGKVADSRPEGQHLE